MNPQLFKVMQMLTSIASGYLLMQSLRAAREQQLAREAGQVPVTQKLLEQIVERLGGTPATKANPQRRTHARYRYEDLA